MINTKVSAIVLAGGNSTRMGQNKALLKIGEKTLIELVVETLHKIFDEIIVVTNNPENYTMLEDVRFEGDCIETPVKNSLVGLYTGLIRAKNDRAFVVACDMPFLNKELIEYIIKSLGDEDLLIPFIEGHYQPLHAIYNKTCLDIMRNMIIRGNYKIIDFYDDVNTIKINEDIVRQFDPLLKSFMNINTKEVYNNLDTFSNN